MPFGADFTGGGAGASSVFASIVRLGGHWTSDHSFWLDGFRLPARRRTQAQRLADLDEIGILQLVPGCQLLVVEAVVERNAVQRIAALDRVGVRPPISFHRRFTCTCGARIRYGCGG